MQTIQSRAYTNAIMTVIAILLAVAVFQNYFQFATPALAQRPERLLDNKTENSTNRNQVGDLAVADANREIAKALREMAAAMKDASEKDAAASGKIAQALGALAGPTK